MPLVLKTYRDPHKATKPEARLTAAVLEAFRAMDVVASRLEDESVTPGFDLVRTATATDFSVSLMPFLLPRMTPIFASAIETEIAKDRELSQTRQLVLSYAEATSAILITSISDTQRRTIKSIIVDAIRRGTPGVRDMARQIRSTIGLLPRQATALVNYAAQLAEEGMSQERMRKLLAARKKKMITSRASTIARTELAFANNGGKFEDWKRKIDQGLLSRTIQKQWIGLDPCPICIQLAGLGPVPFGDPFYSELAGRSWMHPPAHPNCKCSVGLSRGKP